MRTLLIVCLAVQSFVHLPPWDGTKQKQGAENKTRSADSRQQSSTSPAAAGASGINQPAAGEQKKPPEQETDEIWKKAFAPETWSNWALFAAAVAAAIIGLRTLGEIRVQARIARVGLKAARIATSAAAVSAKAARESADTAARSAELAEKALHVTERADILLDAAGGCEHELNADTVFRLRFKNYGRTRANRTEVIARLLLPGMKPEKDLRPVSSVALGAGKALTVKFHPLGDSLTKDIFRLILAGKQTLRFHAEVAYFDVFDKPHHTKCSGTLLPDSCHFRIDENQESD